MKHYEIINDIFNYQLLNDHKNACEHQALLISRKELGISDEEWIKSRDSCWIQNTWSATITPKGCFFCEVAGALDMLFDGPGGWEVTKDWWKRQPEDFNDQLHWCELCSACLDVPTRLSHDGRDDVSPLMIEKLSDIGSSKIKKGQYVAFDTSTYNREKYHGFKSSNDYMDVGDNKNRRIIENPWSLGKNVLICQVDEINSLLNTGVSGWILILPKRDSLGILEELSKYIFNPGVLYRYRGCILFNTTARSVRTVLNAIHNLDDLLLLYPEEKKITIYALNYFRARESICYYSLRVKSLFGGLLKKVKVYGGESTK